MTNKVVNLTLTNLDITQLYKIRQDPVFTNKSCSPTNVSGAYRYELRELIDAILEAGSNNISEIKAPKLTI